MVSDVTGQPVIQSQPESRCVWLGSNATLAVTAFGTTPLDYQWQFNGTNILDATNSTLTLYDVQFSEGASYTVTASNSLGSVSSAPAIIRVLSDYSALLDVNFTGATQNKTGAAAAGLATNDLWDEYRNSGNAGAVTMTNLQWSDGITSPVSPIGMTVSNAPGTWGNHTGDTMYDMFIYPWNGGDVFVILTNLPANSYDFYLYGHSANAWENSKFQMKYGTNITAWEQTQDSTFASVSSNWVEKVQYVVFRGVTVTNNQPVTIMCAPGDGGSAVFNGFQVLLPMPSEQTDRDGDGLGDNWELYYFGRLGLNPDQLDANGNTLLYDYQNGLDPNPIQFSFSVVNQNLGTNAVTALVNVLGGDTPANVAVLVDNTNFSSATWMPYTSPDISINLGTNWGWHKIWIGLQGSRSNAQETWRETNCFLAQAAVKAGYSHVVLLPPDGTVWAWGYNGDGELGNGTLSDSTNPVQVIGLSNIVAVAVQEESFHTLALDSSGLVWSWGKNSDGQLGWNDGLYTNENIPASVPGLSNIVAIANGMAHSVALKKRWNRLELGVR